MSALPGQDDTRISLQVGQAQAEGLESLFEIAKALASPGRLAILGVLAARPKEVISLETLAEKVGLGRARIIRDVSQLAGAGLLQVIEWQTTAPGREPTPTRLTFHPDYLKRMPQLITTLHQLNSQLQPAEQVEPLDERAKTLGRFMKDGRLVGWPAQFKRQQYLIEAVAGAFEPEVRYSEAQVDTILKEIYDYDHCTLRRYLVDLKFLQRADGVYWKENDRLPAV